jgi:hypothetical protein
MTKCEIIKLTRSHISRGAGSDSGRESEIGEFGSGGGCKGGKWKGTRVGGIKRGRNGERGGAERGGSGQWAVGSDASVAGAPERGQQNGGNGATCPMR